ncbi:MAG: alkaline phosphatase family protein [Bacteroidota bacterium]
MINLRCATNNILLAALTLFLGMSPGTSCVAGPSKRTVLLFVVDGLQTDAAMVAINNGASMMKLLHDNGVWVREAYCSSPSARLYLPDNSTPWGTAAPPNVAMHTGTHVFESREMDDIFLAARRAGIKSVFSGSADNYKVFDTADFCFASSNMDSLVIEFAIEHLTKDHTRLLSLHVQQTRRNWTGPADMVNPQSRYQQYLLQVDQLLGKLVRALQSEGVWDSTYVILFSDHGMGQTSASEHPATELSSWKPYMNFYGPGIKKGKSIPYAETPDVAILADYLLQLSPLAGHKDLKVGIQPRGTTGTLLTNLFENNPDDIKHPQFIRRYLESRNWSPPDDFADYRAGMLKLMAK